MDRWWWVAYWTWAAFVLAAVASFTYVCIQILMGIQSAIGGRG